MPKLITRNLGKGCLLAAAGGHRSANVTAGLSAVKTRTVRFDDHSQFHIGGNGMSDFSALITKDSCGRENVDVDGVRK